MLYFALPRLAALAATSCLTAVAVAQTNQDRIGNDYLPADALATAALTASDTMASPAAELYPTEAPSCTQPKLLMPDVNRILGSRLSHAARVQENQWTVLSTATA